METLRMMVQQGDAQGTVKRVEELLREGREPENIL